MPKRSSKARETDPNVRAFMTVMRATGQVPDEDAPAAPEKNPNAVALGKLGGLKGGKARAKALSATKRKAIAKKAARARWQRAVR
jgi:hypothetical protein